MTNFDWTSFTLEWVWYPQYPALFPISSCSYFFLHSNGNLFSSVDLTFLSAEFGELGLSRQSKLRNQPLISKMTLFVYCTFHAGMKLMLFDLFPPLIFRLISSSRTFLFTECVYFAQRCNSRSVAGCVLPGFFLTHPFIDSLALFGKPSVLILMVFPIFLPCN